MVDIGNCNTVDFLDVYEVRTLATAATPACSRPGEEAFVADNSYNAIDGDVLLGDNFPSEWCMLASVNCDDTQAGQLLNYEDSEGYGFGLSVNADSVTFGMRDESWTQSDVDVCTGSWNQFSVCYDGGQLVLHSDCTDSVLLARPTDPGLGTVGGSLMIFANSSGDNEYTVGNI